MATVRDIITQALRRAGVVGINREAKAQEADNGLFILQGMIDGWFSSGVLGSLTDVYATEDYTAKEYERIVTDGASVTIPTTFEEDGKTRAPKEWAIIVSNGVNMLWDGQWRDCSDLALGDYCPFSTKGKDGLACLLAVNWVDTFGGAVSPFVMQRARDFHSILLGNRATATDSVAYF